MQKYVIKLQLNDTYYQKEILNTLLTEKYNQIIIIAHFIGLLLKNIKETSAIKRKMFIFNAFFIIECIQLFFMSGQWIVIFNKMFAKVDSFNR